MMNNRYEKAKIAYENYNLNSEYNLTENLLKSIKERIEANKKEIDELLKIYKRNYVYSDIKKVIDEEIEKKIQYKRQVSLKRRTDNFVSTIYATSVGIVAVECYDLLECIKYMIRAIKTRNSLIISDVEYEENDEKHLILLIIQESMRKFNIDQNLIQILPYEECDYDKCDRVIYTYENKQNLRREETEKMYIYLENKLYAEEAEKEYNLYKNEGKDIELVEGNINQVIDKINEKVNYGAVIYTGDSKLGYKFIKLVRSKNVFVNSTLTNSEKIENNKDDLLMNKKIMYEYST